MVAVALAFLAVAALTFVGFGAGRLFQRTRFPDAPVLLAIGLLLGPGNAMLARNGLGSQALADALAPDKLRSAAPLVAGLALVVILFDSGLELRFRVLRRSLGPAVLHTGAILVLSVAGIAALSHFVFGMPWLVGTILGVVLSSVDQTVSAGLVQAMRLPDAVRAVSVVEMALYDLTAIPILVSLFALVAGGGTVAGLGPAAKSFFSIVALSVVVGAAFGTAWAYALRPLRGHPNSYMLTFAAVLATYGVGELVGGSGALAILLFGLIVGNRRDVMRGLSGIREVDTEGVKVQAFHDEITFFIRTLFFLFLGVSFQVDLGGAGNLLVPGAILAAAVLVAARWIGLRVTAVGPFKANRGLFPVFGRGLDSAVLATLPFVTASFVQGRPGQPFYDLMQPWQAMFTNLALLLIVFTVLASAFFVFAQERAISHKQRLADARGMRPLAEKTRAGRMTRARR